MARPQHLDPALVDANPCRSAVVAVVIRERPIGPDTPIRITPSGALAGAFSALVKEAEDPKAWWRTSPLLAGIGLAHHLRESGWMVVPMDDDPEVPA